MSNMLHNLMVATLMLSSTAVGVVVSPQMRGEAEAIYRHFTTDPLDIFAECWRGDADLSTKACRTALLGAVSLHGSRKVADRLIAEDGIGRDGNPFAGLAAPVLAETLDRIAAELRP